MSECAFDLILAEWAESEWEEYADAQEIKTSKKHDRAMQRIFKRYEKNTRKLRPNFKVSSVTKRTLIVVLAVFLALIAGCSAAYFVSHGFSSAVYPDCVEIFLYNGKDNCPNTLENKFYLSGLPEDYKIIQTTDTSSNKSTLYQNEQTGQLVMFEYGVKSTYYCSPMFFDTENGRLSEIKINDNYGLYQENGKPPKKYITGIFRFFHEDSDYSNINSCIWDNGDYIFEIYSDLPKKDIVNLAKSAKIL